MPQHTARPPYSARDFDISPLMFYYEVTLACDLVCKHCRASAQAERHPEELTPDQALALMAQVATFPRRPTLVLTGGDPLKRPDLVALIRAAVSQGLEVALTPSATPLATREAFQQVREAGVSALGISLDGADAATHDAFRGWEGSFARTMQMLDDARRLALPVQVNTTITRRNVHQVDAMAALLAEQGIAMWSVFFLVPVGRGVEEQRIRPEEYEEVFARLWYHAQRQPYAVKTTEAPHYRRFVLQQGGDPLAGPVVGSSPVVTGSTAGPVTGPVEDSSPALTPPAEDSKPSAGPAVGTAEDGIPALASPAAASSSAHRRLHRAPLGIGDGKGIMFVSHTGEIYPAGFLPLCCGRFPQHSVVEVYQNHPIFRALRNPDGFKGRCGVCEYRYVCGGSRARAYAVTGDPLESEPDCVYVPLAWRRS